MRSRLSTRRNQEEGYGVSTLELFFDLVFVFAITQVSHLLLEHLSWRGALESGLVLMVVWWAWMYTTWVTNELDPDTLPVRFLLLTIMMASLLLAVAIPEAFGAKGLLFALSYVFIQLLRQWFLAFVASPPGSDARNRAVHILTWFLFSAPFWIGGAFFEGEARLAIWVFAMGIDVIAPSTLYFVPWLRKLSFEDWTLGSGHFAERFTAADDALVPVPGGVPAPLAAALGIAGLAGWMPVTSRGSTACLWWLYFNYMATILERVLEEADSRTEIGRDIFTYGHIPIIAGIILCAVGDELVLAHPTEYLHTPELIAVVAGPTLYLLAFAPIRWKVTRGLPWRRLAGAAACVLVGLFSWLVHPVALVTAGLLLAVLITVIAHEHFLRIPRREPAEQ